MNLEKNINGVLNLSVSEYQNSFQMKSKMNRKLVSFLTLVLRTTISKIGEKRNMKIDEETQKFQNEEKYY